MNAFKNINVAGVVFMWRVGDQFTEVRLRDDNSVFLRLVNAALLEKTYEGQAIENLVRNAILEKVKE